MIFNKENKFLLIKIFKSYLKDFDIYNKDDIINLFKFIFIKIKKKYNLSGLFNVDIYVNSDYGMIIEINNLYYLDNESDMKINIHLDSIFLVEISSNEIFNHDEIYYYNNKFYSKYNQLYDSYVIYKNIDEIISNGIKIC